jgi:hypothetical protein
MWRVRPKVIARSSVACSVIHNGMRLLVDNDFVCKLGVVGLLAPLLAWLGVDVSECGRLPALPHMLGRGKLPRKYGEAACASVIPMARAMGLVPTASTAWLERLTDVPNIDPGEVQLFASAAEHSLTVATADKRALVALAKVDGFAEPLAGRIMTFEAALLVLCRELGDDHVRAAVQPLKQASDGTVQICFSDGNPNPRDGLVSYFDGLKREAAPLVLWDPASREGA